MFNFLGSDIFIGTCCIAFGLFIIAYQINKGVSWRYSYKRDHPFGKAVVFKTYAFALVIIFWGISFLI